MKNKKKLVLAGALVLVMAVSAVGGTVAWFSTTDSLENTFLVGVFTPPTDPNPNPDPPGPNPDPDTPYPDPVPPKGEGGKVNSYIYEPYWESNGDPAWNGGKGDNHRLLAGGTTVKDPYVGLGKDSESGYVLVYIENPMADHVYFTLGNGWLPVDGKATKVTIDDTNSSPTKTEGAADTADYYSKGLFKWVGVDGSDHTVTTADTLGVLNPDTNNDGTGDREAWTDHPVFTYVYTAKNGMTAIQGMDEGKQKMTVHAFIHQTNGTSNSGEENKDADYTTVVAAATAWADKIANPTPAGS